MTRRKSQSILELTHDEARQFFLKDESYCNFDLPQYFVFSQLLADIDTYLTDKNISDFKIKDNLPNQLDKLNHIILNNKDGKYGWRPLQLIHPALYVSLVHQITELSNWEIICIRFLEFNKDSKIKCLSMPVESLSEEKDKAEQISSWWHAVEQKSIELSLEFDCLIQLDLTDCYASIYTHSIAWALHGKEFAKQKGNRGNKKLIGNTIDDHIRDMSYGQTNGIPQGSVLMDFVAEMVLGYADLCISEKIQSHLIEDYYILRYRDDYRIFVNNTRDGENIVKIIAEIMIDFGLKLNPSKTKVSDKVIRESIKSDKLHWMGKKQKDRNLQKHLLIIHNHASEFPNSGSLSASLSEFHKRIIRYNSIEDAVTLISIIIDITFNNPKTYAISSAILSKLIDSLNSDEKKRETFHKIKKRFDKIPNTGHIQIWLQRIYLSFAEDLVFDESLCRLAAGEKSSIWNLDWISSDDFKKLMDPEKIIDHECLKEVVPVISVQEVELFMSKSKMYY